VAVATSSTPIPTVSVSQTPPAVVGSGTPIPSGPAETGGGVVSGSDVALAAGGGSVAVAAGGFGLLAVRRWQRTSGRWYRRAGRGHRAGES
jgi:hypothetical protein